MKLCTIETDKGEVLYKDIPADVAADFLAGLYNGQAGIDGDGCYVAVMDDTDVINFIEVSSFSYRHDGMADAFIIDSDGYDESVIVKPTFGLMYCVLTMTAENDMTVSL